MNSTLYLRNDPFESCDAVFAVKSSLLIDIGTVTRDQAAKYGALEGSALIYFDFVLSTVREIEDLKAQSMHSSF